MHTFLRRLELQGFKSFAQKTTLEFPASVVAIVGPNGSGKSNVIDALRWVLGEREAKQLRGATLETLIFGGTPKRPASGLARVSLVFDNRARQFPFDTEEVLLSRRIDRSGLSEYTIQGEEIKLRDLVPLLARARLGSRGLTMVSQGQSDIFVKAGAHDRRAMIEEVLGLREFRIKKDQAERRLEASTVNLDKVRALLEEIGPHLKLLRRQKHRWDRRAEIETELRTLEDGYFALRYQAIADGAGDVAKPLETLEKAIQEKQKAVASCEATVRASEKTGNENEELLALRARVRTCFETGALLERDKARIEAKREYEAKAATATHSAHELEGAFDTALTTIERILTLDTFDAVRRGLAELRESMHRILRRDVSLRTTDTAELVRIEEAIVVATQELAIARRSEESIVERERASVALFRTNIEALNTLQNELRELEERRSAHTLAGERLRLQREELEREWMTLDRSVHELHALHVPDDTAPFQGEAAYRRILRLRGERAAIGDIDAAVLTEAEETETRHAHLAKELEDTECAIVDLKKVIRDLDHKIHDEFKQAFRSINEAFNTYFRLMFGGGRAHLVLKKPDIPAVLENENGEPVASVAMDDAELTAGVEVEIAIPKKRITNLEMLSGGEKSLVSLAALFALISVSAPPFLVLDEIDAPLDEENARRFAELIREFAKKTQFIIITHNRSTMEAADILYGVTMAEDGVSKILSLKFENETA